MASRPKRTSIPSIGDLLDTPDKKAASLLDNMLSEAERSTKDDGFEVIDAGGPAMFNTTSTNPSKPRTMKIKPLLWCLEMEPGGNTATFL